MTQQPEPTTQNETALAFEDLRKEVSFMREAIRGLTAARERIPDYTETLGWMSAQLKATLAGLDRIERSPAVSLSPEEMTTEIVKAGTSARAADARMLNEARDACRVRSGASTGSLSEVRRPMAS